MINSSARTIQLMESKSSYDELCLYDYVYKCNWLQRLICTMNKCKCKSGDIWWESNNKCVNDLTPHLTSNEILIPTSS